MYRLWQNFGEYFIRGMDKQRPKQPPREVKLLYWALLTLFSFWLLTERVQATTMPLLIFGFVVVAACMWALVNLIIFPYK